MDDTNDIKSKLSSSKVAFIGAGQMGEALMKGMLSAGVIQNEQVILSDIRQERLLELREKYRVDTAKDNVEAVERAQLLFFSIKPQQFNEVLPQIAFVVRDDHLVISIAAGITTKKICALFDRKARVIRVMPNTPALVGAGISVISRGEFATAEDEAIATTLFSAIGGVVNLPETLQNEAMAVSGCGPAYFYLFVKALAEAGVKHGLSRETALKLAIETLVGAGEMLSKTGKEPQELIDMVTSPGGTTLAALTVLEEVGFEKDIIKAVEAAIKRAYELGS